MPVVVSEIKQLKTVVVVVRGSSVSWLMFGHSEVAAGAAGPAVGGASCGSCTSTSSSSPRRHQQMREDMTYGNYRTVDDVKQYNRSIVS